MEEESVRLAIRLKDDSVWKISNLSGTVIPYKAAAGIVHHGKGLAGRPVEETVLLYRLSNALETTIANADHPLDEDLFDCFKEQLGASKDIPLPDHTNPTEENATDMFMELWNQDRILAAVCANHLLVEGGIGLFGTYPDQLPALESAIGDSNEAAISYIHDNAVELLPGGLTRNRMPQ